MNGEFVTCPWHGWEYSDRLEHAGRKSIREHLSRTARSRVYPQSPEFTMHSHVLRFTLVTGALVVAACVYDAPVTPTGNTITAANVSNGYGRGLTFRREYVASASATSGLDTNLTTVGNPSAASYSASMRSIHAGGSASS